MENVGESVRSGREFWMKTLTNKDVADLYIGCTITNCGGGGGQKIERLRQFFPDVFETKGLQLADPNSFEDDDLIFQVSPCGGGVDPEILKLLRKTRKKLSMVGSEGFVALAGRKLAEKIGEEPKGYLSFENGIICNLVAMEVSSLNHKPVVDASPVGRAVPEMCLSTLNARGFVPECIVLTSPFGDTVVVEDVYDYERIEEISRFFATSCGGACGFAIPLRGKHLKNAVEHKTISHTIDLGRTIKNNGKRSQTPIETLLNLPGIYLIFEGVVSKIDIEPKFAYETGEVWIKGSEIFNGKTLKIWIKNENLMTWLDEKPYVTGPDHIVIVNRQTAEGLSNHELAVGTRVSIIGRKAHEIWRSKEGLEVFSPKHFGFDADYKPVEQFF